MTAAAKTNSKAIPANVIVVARGRHGEAWCPRPVTTPRGSAARRMRPLPVPPRAVRATRCFGEHWPVEDPVSLGIPAARPVRARRHPESARSDLPEGRREAGVPGDGPALRTGAWARLDSDRRQELPRSRGRSRPHSSSNPAAPAATTSSRSPRELSPRSSSSATRFSRRSPPASEHHEKAAHPRTGPPSTTTTRPSAAT